MIRSLVLVKYVAGVVVSREGLLTRGSPSPSTPPRYKEEDPSYRRGSDPAG